MKKVYVICIGDLKLNQYKDIQKIYLKKIGRLVDIQLIQLKDVNAKSETDNRELEGERILAKIKKGDYVISLDSGGKQYDSRELARFIENKHSYHPGRLVFIIGGFSGLSPELDSVIQCKVSFSRLTINHDLFRLFFFEQLYRVFTLIKGITYHR